jgi:hypothetical protein
MSETGLILVLLIVAGVFGGVVAMSYWLDRP